ncbi:hypothetical protein [Candidatus Methylomirabilis sp.]|nr:hypothetical protein [Candidatus Methylomirabilis sp.]
MCGRHGRALSKELYVKFTECGVVESYFYISNLPEEVQRHTR